MSFRTIFNCDVCPTANITDGITMIFEIDQSGDISAPKHRLVKTVKGLHSFPNSSKVVHICNICEQSIVNAKEMKSKEMKK
jgi:hypothetical protein